MERFAHHGPDGVERTPNQGWKFPGGLPEAAAVQVPPSARYYSVTDIRQRGEGGGLRVKKTRYVRDANG